LSVYTSLQLVEDQVLKSLSMPELALQFLSLVIIIPPPIIRAMCSRGRWKSLCRTLWFQNDNEM